MRKIIKFLVIGIIFNTACEEFNTTQKEAPQFVFENNITSIPADGSSWVTVTLKFHRLMAVSQPVTITTSNGSLAKFPVTSFTTSTNTLEVAPNSDEFKFVLVAGTSPEPNVLLSATLNNKIALHEFEFTRVCPSELLFDINDSQLSISLAERSTGTLTLFDNGGPVSDGTRIDITLDNDTIAQVEPRVFQGAASSTITIVPLGIEGEVTITATINQSDCNSLSSSNTISIIP